MTTTADNREGRKKTTKRMAKNMTRAARGMKMILRKRVPKAKKMDKRRKVMGNNKDKKRSSSLRRQRSEEIPSSKKSSESSKR